MKNLDSTLDFIENARFNYIYAGVISKMQKETIFSEYELTCIMMIFHKFVLERDRQSRVIDNNQMCVILQTFFNIVDTYILNRICDRMRTFDPVMQYSTDHRITPIAFIKLFDIYYSDNLEQRIEFAFAIYDSADRGFVDREDVSRAVDNFFADEDEDEVHELQADMVDLLLMKFDEDKDNIISFDEYRNRVRRSPELLQFMGAIFPQRRHLETTSHVCNLLGWWDKTVGKFDE